VTEEKPKEDKRFFIAFGNKEKAQAFAEKAGAFVTEI
jgi:hypothetical protein